MMFYMLCNNKGNEENQSRRGKPNRHHSLSGIPMLTSRWFSNVIIRVHRQYKTPTISSDTALGPVLSMDSP